jgi:hypothetical protein
MLFERWDTRFLMGHDWRSQCVEIGHDRRGALTALDGTFRLSFFLLPARLVDHLVFRREK